MRLMKTTFLMISVVVLLAGPAMAGWVQQDGEGSRLYIQDGKIKEVPEEADEPWSVTDLANGRVLLVNPGTRTYAQMDISQFCQYLSQVTARLGQQAKTGGEIEIVEKGPGPKIAGLSTVKYEVMSGGQLREELWLTREAPFVKDFDLNLLGRFVACGAGPNDVESSPEYQKLMSLGWVLRSVDHTSGDPSSETDVKSLVQKHIPAEEFAAPAGYKQVPLEKVLSMD